MVQKVLISSTPEATPSASRRSAYRIAPNLLISFRYALAGLQYAFLTQRNFRIHTVVGTLALSLGISLHLPMVEVAVIALTVALVLGMELLNTALEAVVDLTVGRTYHELAKVAKDCAAGAVLVAAMGSLLIALCLLLPPLWQNLTSYLLYH
jgi:diacylglycerol kinase (ATP)